jgi:hypothetical protein
VAVSDEAVDVAARADHAHGRLALTSDPDWDGLTEVDRESYRDAARVYLAAAAPPIAAQERGRIAALLRRGAAGRREYAANAPDAQRQVLEIEANVLDHAAKVAGGDLGPMLSWMPSWRWTDEMTRWSERGGDR